MGDEHLLCAGAGDALKERSDFGPGPYWAQVRIYELREVEESLGAAPASVLDARFQMGLCHACAWAQNPSIACAICGRMLEGHATYVAVLMPLDESMPMPSFSGAVCTECGKEPRGEVLRRVEYSALLMFGGEGGHA